MPFTGYGQSDIECDKCVPVKRCALHDDRPVYPGHRNDGPVDLSKFGTPTGRGTFYFGRPRVFPKVEPLPRQCSGEQAAVQPPVHNVSEHSSLFTTCAEPSISDPEKETTQKFNDNTSVSPKTTVSPLTGNSPSMTNRDTDNITSSANGSVKVPGDENEGLQLSNEKHSTQTKEDSAAQHARPVPSGFSLDPVNKYSDGKSLGRTELERKTNKETQSSERWVASTHGFDTDFENKLRGVGMDGPSDGGEIASIPASAQGGTDGSSKRCLMRASSSSHWPNGETVVDTGGGPACTKASDEEQNDAIEQNDKATVADDDHQRRLFTSYKPDDYPPLI